MVKKSSSKYYIMQNIIRLYFEKIFITIDTCVVPYKKK